MVSLTLLSSAASACQVDAFNFVWGSDSASHIALRNAESCKFGFRVSKRGHLASVAVTQSPQHGTLSPADPTHWIYKPARGYTGQDVISVKASGDQMGNKRISSGDTNLEWTVEVTP